MAVIARGLRLLVVSLFPAALVLAPRVAHAQSNPPAEQAAAVSPPQTAGTQRRTPPPLARPIHETPLAAGLAAARLAAPDELNRLREWNRSGRRPTQTGFSRALPETIRVRLAAGAASDKGVIEETPDRALVWSARFEIAESAGIRVHLRDVALPAGSLLWVRTADRTEGPFEAAAMLHEGEIWTPAVRAGSGVLAIEIPAEAIDATPAAQRAWTFAIDRVIDMVPPEGRPQSGSSGRAETDSSHCLINGECVTSTTYPSLAYARAAAAQLDYVSGGRSWDCSGGLLNDRYGTLTPYFLTANHCFSTQTEASSLVAYWDYRYDGCSFPANLFSSWSASTAGATLLATSPNTDFTFVRLPSLPGGRVLMGWSAGFPSDGTALHAITHPGGSPQHYTRIAVDTTPAYGGCGAQPRFIYGNVVSGATQGGSSGGLYATAAGQVVGQLYGACGDASDDCATGNYNELVGALSETYHSIRTWIDTNNECVDAIPIGGSTYSYTMLINGATTGSVTNPCGSAYYSSWWKYTAPSTIRISVDTIGSQFDALLAIYSGSCTSLTNIDCSDDEPGVPNNAAKVWANVSAGQTYYIMASSYYSSTPGNLTLNLKTCPAKPSGLTAVGISATSIRVTWNAVSGAAGYRLYDSDSGAVLYSGTAPTYTQTGLSSRTSHNYYLYAYNDCGDSSRSDIVPASTCPNNVCPNKVATFVATATSTSQIGLGWTVTSGAASYQVERKVNNGAWQPLVTVTSTFYTNNTGVSANVSYLYRVRAVDGFGTPAPYSDPDVATTILFSDDPLVVRSTIIRTSHIAQLRTAVNAIRAAAGLLAFSFTDPTPTGTSTSIKAVHVSELRTALNAARSTIGLPAVVYSQPTLTVRSTRVFAADITELRNGVK